MGEEYTREESPAEGQANRPERYVEGCGKKRTKQKEKVYSYAPNEAASIVFCNFFGISMCWHIFQCIKYKSWKVTGALAWGCLLFVVGFALRQVSIRHIHDLGIFIAKEVLLLCAPPIFSLTNYILLGRVLYYIPYLSPMHPGRVISTFVGLDVVVGALTGNGAARVSNFSNSESEIRSGRDQIRASILLQVVFFLAFVTLEVIFHRRCLRANVVSTKLRAVFYLLYASSTLILIRNIYRVVEVFEGYTGYLATHEAFFYIFDGALMLINTVMFNICHPMMFLPNSTKVYLSKDGVTEREGPGWVDKRPFLVTIIDPFDLVGLVMGRDKRDKFWENEEEHQVDGDVSGEAVSHEPSAKKSLQQIGSL